MFWYHFCGTPCIYITILNCLTIFLNRENSSLSTKVCLYLWENEPSKLFDLIQSMKSFVEMNSNKLLPFVFKVWNISIFCMVHLKEIFNFGICTFLWFILFNSLFFIFLLKHPHIKQIINIALDVPELNTL